MHETTALGAAIAAGYAVGIWKEFHELAHMNRANRTTFSPLISPIQSEKMYKKWTRAVNMSRGWVEEEELEQVEQP